MSNNEPSWKPALRASIGRLAAWARGFGIRRWLIGAAVVLFVGSVLAFFLKAHHAKNMVDPASARKKGRPIPVRTALVTETQVEQIVGATAVTVASVTAQVRIGASRVLSPSTPDTDIVIKALHVHDGQQVSRGQLLIEIEDDLFRHVVQQRRLAVDRFAAEIKRVKDTAGLNESIRAQTVTRAEEGVKFRVEDLNTRKTECEVLEKLMKGRASSEFDYYEARSKLSHARYDLSTAELGVEIAKAAVLIGRVTDARDLAKATNDHESAIIDLEAAQHDHERCKIRSPIDGFLGSVDMNVPGTVATVGQPLTQVLQLDPIHVRMDYPQERVDEVGIGQKAEIVLDSFPKETFTGKVIRILPQVRPDLRTLPVLIEVSNPGCRLKPGISGFVRLRTTRKARVVPALAVMERGGKSIAYRIEDGRARLCQVQTGPVVETGMLELRGGLQPGDEVVVFHANFYRHYGSLVSGGAFLQDADLVDVDWRKWARRE